MSCWIQSGEERFSVEWDENDRVWYEIFSFSKPAHLLSAIGYPYVQLRQRFFAEQSTNALRKHIAAQQPTNWESSKKVHDYAESVSWSCVVTLGRALFPYFIGFLILIIYKLAFWILLV